MLFLASVWSLLGRMGFHWISLENPEIGVYNRPQLVAYLEIASNQGIYEYQRVLNFKMRCSDLRNSQHSARETAMSAVQFRDFGIPRCEPPYH